MTRKKTQTRTVVAPGRRLAYTAVIAPDGTYRLGVAEEGVPGYFPCKDHSDAGGTFPSWDAAMKVAEGYNERCGLTPEEAWKIVASTMGQRHGQGSDRTADRRV